MTQIALSPGTSIQEALSQIPNDEPVQIVLNKGIYREKISLDRHNLSVVGSGKRESVIINDDFNFKMHRDGRQYNTFRTPTMTLTGSHVTLTNLTIANDAGSGDAIGQAVALALYGDDVTVSDCTVDGYQDTLFLGPLPVDLTKRYEDLLPDTMRQTEPCRHRFLHSTISGSVDFIFGSATALFLDCEILVKKPGYIAAPSTYADNSIGFVFWHSTIRNQSGSDQVFLARPWREHGYVYYQDCHFEGGFSPDRYDAWGKATFRFYENPFVPSSMSRGLSKESIQEISRTLETLFSVKLMARD